MNHECTYTVLILFSFIDSVLYKHPFERNKIENFLFKYVSTDKAHQKQVNSVLSSKLTHLGRKIVCSLLFQETYVIIENGNPLVLWNSSEFQTLVIAFRIMSKELF